MRHRRKSYRDYEDDDPDSLGETLAEVNDRLDDLSRQVARIARRTYGDDRGIPANQVPTGQIPASQIPISLGEALAHFDRRLEQIAAAERAARAIGTIRDEHPSAASNWLPAFDPAAPKNSTPPNPTLKRAVDTGASAHAAAAPAEPARDLGGLEHQLRNITEQLAALHKPCRIDDAVLTLHNDLSEISRLLNEAMPRDAIEVLEKQVRALAERIDRSRDSGSDNAKHTQLERGLAEVRDTLLNLKTAENLVEIKEAVTDLARRIDQVAANNHNPGALQKLDQAVAGLRVIVSHVASNETVGKLADEVRGLSSRFEHAITESNAKAISHFERQIAALMHNGRNESIDTTTLVKTLGEQLDHRIATLIDSSRNEPADTETLAKTLGERINRGIAALMDSGRTVSDETVTLIKALGAHLDKRFAMLVKDNHSISPEVGTLIRTLIEKLDHMQPTEGDTLALGNIEDRLDKLAGKLDASDAWLDRLGAIERGITDVLTCLEEQSRSTQPALRMEMRTVAAHAPEAGIPVPPETTAEMPMAQAPPSSPTPSPPLDTIIITAPSTGPAPRTAYVAAQEPDPLDALNAATVSRVESPHPQLRRPIDPNLPPDTPIEPSAEASHPRASAADRIMASEAALGSAKPAGREVASQFETLIAARRAAFTAGLEAATTGIAPFKPVLAEIDESPKRRLGSYLRWLLLAASVVIILLGGLRVAVEMWHSPEPAMVPSSLKNAPSEIPPSAAPDAANGNPAMPMPSPQAVPDLPAENPAPNSPPGSPPDTPGADPTPIDGSSTKTEPFGDARPKTMPEVTGTVTRQDPEHNRTVEPTLPVTIGGAMLRAAAIEGNSAAQYEIGVRYAEGRSVTANVEEAARWFERAAKSGFAPAQFRLGGLYDKGGGLKRDRALARQLYLAAAEKGHAKAMHNLAVLYAEGMDGRPNYRAAAQWFGKAADYGIADSQYNLAILYIRGIGVEQNLTESYKWFALAANQGDQEAAKKRDEVAERLDPQALNTAQHAVQTFRVAQQPEQAVSLQVPSGGWDRANANVQPARPRTRPSGSDSPTLNLLSPAPL